METCSTLYSSFHRRCISSSLLPVQCEESFPPEIRRHAVAEMLRRRVSHDFSSFSSPSLPLVKARGRSQKHSLKRQSLMSVLKPSLRSSLAATLKGRRRGQLLSLPLDLPFQLSVEMAPDEVAGEHPSSVALCKDLDWKRLAQDLRKEAVSGINPDGSTVNMSEKAGLHQVAFEVEPRNETRIEWDASSAAAHLRSRVSFEVAQELVRSKNSAIDDENTEILWLQRQILSMCTRLNEHVSQIPAPEDMKSLENQKKVGDHVWKAQQMKATTSSKFLTMIVALLLTHTASIMHAFAAEDGNSTMQESLSQPLEEASRAPAWLIPVVLAFPVASYFLFNFYRDQVNPYAKLSDWLFGVVVLVIIGNLVTMATLGVRLY